MPHPLLHLIASRPQLAVEHAEAYAELVSAEAGLAWVGWKRGALLNAAALCCIIVAAVLAGVALMVWAAIPVAQMPAPWALIAAPLAPAAVAVWCLLASRAPAAGTAFVHLRSQIKADMAMLREVGGV